MVSLLVVSARDVPPNILPVELIVDYKCCTSTLGSFLAVIGGNYLTLSMLVIGLVSNSS